MLLQPCRDLRRSLCRDGPELRGYLLLWLQKNCAYVVVFHLLRGRFDATRIVDLMILLALPATSLVRGCFRVTVKAFDKLLEANLLVTDHRATWHTFLIVLVRGSVGGSLTLGIVGLKRRRGTQEVAFRVDSLLLDLRLKLHYPPLKLADLLVFV